jgi:hypothetical protein
MTLLTGPNWTGKLDHDLLTAIGPGGFEPPLTDPKSAVLPLDEGPARVKSTSPLPGAKRAGTLSSSPNPYG